MASTVQSLRRTLTADETRRAERFYFQKDRDRFIVARGLLRSILSRYLNMEPSQLRFRYGAHGKPDLATASGGHKLRFNLSHSNGLALYAITRDREIGVDIEYIRADFPGLQVAEHFFSPREIATLRALPAARRHEAFFTFWTLKEAYIKARGQGLTLSLDQLDVSAALEGRAPLLSTNDDLQHFSHWSLQKLVPAPGYIAANAVEGHDWGLKCWQWPKPNA
jgi:4'-phosphopantetheinyl transferase